MADPLVAVLAHAGSGHGGIIDNAPVVVLLVLAATGYAIGVRRAGGDRAVGRSAVGRNASTAVRVGARRLGVVRCCCFAAGLLVVAAALLPPLDTAAETRFSAHMGQHMLLFVVAAPLLAVGAPGLPFLLVLGRTQRARLMHALVRLRRTPVAAVLRPLSAPVTGWLVSVAVLWGWHLPAAYDLALRHEPVHVVEHTAFLVASWMFWWHLTHRGAHRLTGPPAVLYVFIAAAPSAALGAVLTLAAQPLYPEQARAARVAGIAPLGDQQLAGLIMWIPADVVYLAVAVGLMLHWLTRLDADRAVHEGDPVGWRVREPRPTAPSRISVDAPSAVEAGSAVGPAGGAARAGGVDRAAREIVAEVRR